MYKDIYDKIDELAKARQLSRRRLAQLAGINVNTMSTLFKRRSPKFPEKYIEPIAAALNVSPSDIRNANNLYTFPTRGSAFAAEPACTPAAVDAPKERRPDQIEGQPVTFAQIVPMVTAMPRNELHRLSKYIDLLLQDD